MPEVDVVFRFNLDVMLAILGGLSRNRRVIGDVCQKKSHCLATDGAFDNILQLRILDPWAVEHRAEFISPTN